MNQANQKVSGQSSASKKRDEWQDRTADAWFLVRVHDEPEEEEDIPLKGKRVSFVDKGKHIQTSAPVLPQGASSAGDGLFQLPRVWSTSGSFGSQASLFLSDPELKVIRALGVAGQTRAVTEEVIGTMRAL